MSLNATINKIVELVSANQCASAVSLWKRARHEGQACTPCFYSPIDESIRCAECLDTHLTKAQLQRTVTHIDEGTISQIKHNLRVWAKQVQPN